MNFFFAIVLFTLVAMIGEQVLSPRVGDVRPGTQAYEAGFRSGDTILKVDNTEIETWDEFQKAIESRANEDVRVEVVRSDSGEKTVITAEPQLVPNKNVLSWKKMVGSIDGLTYNSRASVVGIADAKSPLAQAGVKSGDIIAAVNNVEISNWRDLEKRVGEQVQSSETMQLKIMRGLGEKKTHDLSLSVAVPAEAKGLTEAEALRALGAELPDTYIAQVLEGSPAEQAGVKFGDKLVAINGKAVGSFEEIQAAIGSFKADQGPLNLTVLRDGEIQTLSVSPEKIEQMNPQGQEEERFAIGIKPMIVDALPATKIWRTINPAEALAKGVSQTVKWTDLTVLSFVRLFQGEVSAKNIGGFISIGQMAKKSWQIGVFQFLNIMAIISINLFILNLLPVPVLDGGHLVFFSVEALRGAPLSMRKLEIAQQVGLILLLSLMVFALFNDVSRLIGSAW